MDLFYKFLLIFVLLLVLRIVLWVILKPIQKYIDAHYEEKLIIRVENRINSMSQNERLSIMNSNKFKKWLSEQWNAGMNDDDMESFKLLKKYILDNFNDFV